MLDVASQGRVGDIEASTRDAAVAAGLSHYFEAAGRSSDPSPSLSSSSEPAGVSISPQDVEVAAPSSAPLQIQQGIDESSSAPVSATQLAIAVTASSAQPVAPHSSREKLRREAAAAISAQLSFALSLTTSRDALEAIPEVASRLRVRTWLLMVLRKVSNWWGFDSSHLRFPFVCICRALLTGP